MTDDELRRSPLHDVHADLGARFTDFGGWEMPVSFSGIREEHRAVREAAGIFDVSHMGAVEVTGPDAGALTGRLTTNDVGALAPGDAQYAAVTAEDGTMLDDVVVYRLGLESYLVVPNAGHDAEVTGRWIDHREAWGLEVAVENATDSWAILAVQGPDAPGLVAAETATDLHGVGRFSFVEAAVAGVECLVSRTGYTGEPGFELLAPWDDAAVLWEAFAAGAGDGGSGDDGATAEPCGLGARDTLRTEMGYLLSGQDFDPEANPRTPFEADVGFAVDLDTDFVGRDALSREQEAGGPDERLAGFVLEARGVPRHGYTVLDADGEPIGEVTSGTMSPTLEEPIGLGYLPVDLAEPGTAIHVEIRGAPKPATVQPTPFIDRT